MPQGEGLRGIRALPLVASACMAVSTAGHRWYHKEQKRRVWGPGHSALRPSGPRRGLLGTPLRHPTSSHTRRDSLRHPVLALRYYHLQTGPLQPKWGGRKRQGHPRDPGPTVSHQLGSYQSEATRQQVLGTQAECRGRGWVEGPESSLPSAKEAAHFAALKPHPTAPTPPMASTEGCGLGSHKQLGSIAAPPPSHASIPPCYRDAWGWARL